MSTTTVFDDQKVSAVYKKLKVGPMKRLYKYYTPSAVNLAGGLPMDSTFPITDVTVKLNDETSFDLHRGQNLYLNYHRGDGLPVVKEWIQQHVQELHTPPCASADSCITVGSTDAMAKILMMIDTDFVLFDKHAYGAAVNATEALGKTPVGVETDSDGMCPNALREAVLTARANGKSANLVYMVPVGQNPTGMTISIQRKAELYAVCKELDLILVEDDAYYYLYFDMKSNQLAGIDHLPKSFLSMDTEGRVLRLDSLSKFICPGARIGWVSGPSDFISKYLLFQEATTQFPSGISQSVFHGLVKHWGREGLNANVKKIQEHYRSQCTVLIEALQEFLPEKYCSYTAPTGGMFLWLTFRNLGAHNHQLTSFDLFKMLVDGGVICVPGDDFLVPDVRSRLLLPALPSDGTSDEHTLSMRVTFAAASPTQLRAAVEKLAKTIIALAEKK